MASFSVWLAFLAGVNLALAAVTIYGETDTGSPAARIAVGVLCLGLALLHQSRVEREVDHG